jgi:hypothetical protein
MNPKVFIIILNWNGKNDTLECLNSLKKITYKNYKVVIVDNGSKDDSVKEIKRNFPNTIIIQNKKNLGFAEGSNVGIRYALKNKADYVLLLNNDTIVDRRFLSEMVKVAESDEKIGIIGSKIYYVKLPNTIWFAGGSIGLKKGIFAHLGQGEKDSKEYSNLGNVDYITGCAMLIKKSVIKSIGLLDHNYFSYVEDVDFCVRAKNAGYKIMLAPKSHIWHKVSCSSGGEDSLLKLYYQNRNKILFIRKHANKKIKLLFFLHFFKDKAIEIMILTIKRKTANTRAILRGIYDGLIYKIDS